MSHHLALCCLSPSNVLSLGLNATQDLAFLLRLVQLPMVAFISDTRSAIVNSTILSDEPWFERDKALYGIPPVSSCRDAVNQLFRDPRTLYKPAITFGPHALLGNMFLNPAIEPYGFALRVQLVKADGKCVVDFPKPLLLRT